MIRLIIYKRVSMLASIESVNSVKHRECNVFDSNELKIV